jgi:ketosteroid isomerase-like protein
MSQENVDNLRRGFKAYARGDLDEALAGLDPDVVYKPIQETAVRGRDAVRASLERWDAEWDEMEMTSEEIIDAGDHLIQANPLSRARSGQRGRGRGPVLPGPHRQRR